MGSGEVRFDDPPTTASQDERIAANLPQESDARVEAVLQVLRGEDVAQVAHRWAIDATVLDRWVTMFVDAGSAVVANRPSCQTTIQRDRFLAAFAFEIRSPLTVAMGWADLMGSGDLAPEDYVRTAASLQASLNHLSERVADAEMLVAASLGGLVLERSRVTAAEICNLPGMPSVRGVGPDLTLDVDLDQFRCVIRDLWNVAGESPRPTARTIESAVRGPWVELSVTRKGDPIEVDHLHALFEPFDQDLIGSNVTVGLYLARALSVAHGGTIGVEQDDEGARFWVRIPRRASEAGQ